MLKSIRCRKTPPVGSFSNYYGEFGVNYQGLGLCYPPQPSASAADTNLSPDHSRYYAWPHPIIINYCTVNFLRSAAEERSGKEFHDPDETAGNVAHFGEQV